MMETRGSRPQGSLAQVDVWGGHYEHTPSVGCGIKTLGLGPGSPRKSGTILISF